MLQSPLVIALLSPAPGERAVGEGLREAVADLLGEVEGAAEVFERVRPTSRSLAKSATFR